MFAGVLQSGAGGKSRHSPDLPPGQEYGTKVSMKFISKTPLLWAAIACAVFLLTPQTKSADNGAPQKRDGQSVLNQLRLKRWTKDLTLSEEQQQKFRALLDEEGKQIAAMDEEQKLTVSERSIKVNELHEGTYAKMRPLLSPTQLEAFEKALTKSSRPKKAKPPVAAPKP